MKNVHDMDRLELESELIERRLQVENLIHEIERKNEYIRIYSDYLNKLMEEKNERKYGKEGCIRTKTRRITKDNK